METMLRFAIEECKLHRSSTGIVMAQRGNSDVFNTETIAARVLGVESYLLDTKLVKEVVDAFGRMVGGIVRSGGGRTAWCNCL